MKALFIIFLLVLLFGCQDTDEIPFQTADPIIVVEGWLTDQPARQYVKLSSTVPFSSPEKSSIINDATVTVYDRSEPIQYISQGNGIYLSRDSVQGIAGRAYYLEIELNTGEIIRSRPETMKEVSAIDSIGFEFFLRENDNTQEDEIVYFPVAFSNDPAGRVNFYRWKLYRNDTLFNKPEEIFLFSDRFVDGNESIPQEFTSYEYRLNDLAKLEIMEISQSAFQFLNELKSQKTTLGTNSAISPAPIKSNLFYPDTDQRVLGFFGIVSVKSKEKIVQ